MKISEFGGAHEKPPKQKSMEQAYDELKDCSHDELFNMLEKEIQKQKASGTFDYEGLKSTLKRVQPFLSAQVYENMLNIVESLK